MYCTLPDSEEQSALSRPEHHSLCSLGKHGLTDQGQLWGHLSESDLLFIIVINIVRIVFGSRRPTNLSPSSAGSPDFNAGSPLASVCACGDPSMLAAVFLLTLESEKENGREKLPAVSGGGLCRGYPKKLLPTCLPPASRKTKSRNLPACRCRFPSRCPALCRNHTGSRGLIVQSTRGSSRPTGLR